MRYNSTESIGAIFMEKFRIKQFEQSFYHKGIIRFDEVKGWPQTLIASHVKQFGPYCCKALKLKKSVQAEKATKLLLETQDRQYVESVLIPMKNYYTVCLSTQIGCPLKCTFCQSGTIPFERNLTAEEITDEYQYCFHEAGTKPSNIVYMGIGEPLLNLENVRKSIEWFCDPRKWGISRRDITISTAGVKGKILELAKNPILPRLTVSLHAPNQQLREKLMPVAKTFSLPELLSEVRVYEKASKHQTTFEYILIAGINDRPEQAHELIQLIKNPLSHINLIPCNSTDYKFQSPNSKTVSELSRILKKHFHRVTVRQSAGENIAAACGQLAAKEI